MRANTIPMAGISIRVDCATIARLTGPFTRDAVGIAPMGANEGRGILARHLARLKNVREPLRQQFGSSLSTKTKIRTPT